MGIDPRHGGLGFLQTAQQQQPARRDHARLQRIGVIGAGL
jgi:hypothetical protein